MNITCSALPEALLESELFGHERGAFTGADRQKRGLLESADGGTVFLDEIGEMVPGLQAKLLRFLEEKSFKRVGGSADIQVDVRVVAATNRKLETEVKEGRFREDLYYRLNVLPIELPPLRARIRRLAAARSTTTSTPTTGSSANGCTGVEPAAMQALKAYGWPGNVRELRNVVERAMLLADGQTLTLRRLSGRLRRSATSRPSRSSCRRRASISSSSNGRWSSRRWSGAAGTRRRPPACSV